MSWFLQKVETFECRMENRDSALERPDRDNAVFREKLEHFRWILFMMQSMFDTYAHIQLFLSIASHDARRYDVMVISNGTCATLAQQLHRITPPTDCLFLWKWASWMHVIWMESKIETYQQKHWDALYSGWLQWVHVWRCWANVNERKECACEQCSVSVIWLSLSFKVHYCCAMHSSLNA